MHRIVEFFDGKAWVKFDPSSLQKEIPMRPWRNVIMAKTMIADEDIAMKPRLGTALGCPYGHEIEFLESGITLWGKDFFWTIAGLVANFKITDEAVALAKREWVNFLATGKLSPGQKKAAASREAAELIESLKSK